MNEEFQHRYHLQGDGEWCGGSEIRNYVAVPLLQYATVTLWDDDTPLATAVYVPVPGDPVALGTYALVEHDMPEESFAEDDLSDWRDWRAALEFATGTKRDEWDKD